MHRSRILLALFEYRMSDSRGSLGKLPLNCLSNMFERQFAIINKPAFSNFHKVRIDPFRTLRKFDLSQIELLQSSMYAISNYIRVRFTEYRTVAKFDLAKIELCYSSIQLISNFIKVRFMEYRTSIKFELSIDAHNYL